MKHSEIMSGVVHTGVEVHRMDSEMSGLVERPWLQLICCAVCLPRGCNFRWRRGSLSGSKCWMVCHRWIPEIEFNKRLSLSIIRLANYSVTTSLSRSLMVDSVFIFSFPWILFFIFFSFKFSIFRTTWVRSYQSRCHINHKLMA